MKENGNKDQNLLKSALGAATAVLCGLLLWKMPFGEQWVNASYDYSFRFGAHSITNKVSLILMDNEAFEEFHQIRGQPWDRALHAKLLNKLADDGCSMVVFDSLFRAPRDSTADAALIQVRLRQSLSDAQQARAIAAPCGPEGDCRQTEPDDHQPHTQQSRADGHAREQLEELQH